MCKSMRPFFARYARKAAAVLARADIFRVTVPKQVFVYLLSAPGMVSQRT